MKDNDLDPEETARDSAYPSLCVRQGVKDQTARQGGWSTTKSLKWSEVRQIRGLAGAARRARKPLNMLATIRAPRNMPDAAGKRVISKEIGHLGEALKRRGQEHVGVTVFEKAPDLHAHHLLYVDPKNADVLTRRADPEGIFQARPAVFEDVGYITKQRVWLGPEIERKKRLPHQRGALIPGKRWTATTAALAIADQVVRSARIEVAVAVSDTPPTVIIPEPTVNAVQLPLFSNLPERIVPFARGIEVRHLREQTGMTQEALTARLGLRDRSHIANVERGHDRLSRPRIRLLRHMVEMMGAAA